MLDTKEIILAMNPELFATLQVAVPNACVISEDKKRVVKDEDGKVIERKFVMTSERDIPGLGKSIYLRASFKKAGEVTAVAMEHKGKASRPAFRGSKKSQAGNIFKNQQPNLFNLLVEEILKKAYTECGKDNDKNTIVEMDMMVYGKKIAVNVPKYHPQRTDSTGKRIALSATKYDPKSNEYKTEQEVTMGVFEFFADEDDLDKLLEVASRLVERQVMPYTVDDEITILKKAGITETTVKLSESKTPLSSGEEIAQAETEIETPEAEKEPEVDA